MRTEIGVQRWAIWFQPFLDGEELKHCRMADEELGCAEVFVLDEQGRRTMETRMVFGHIEDRPMNDIARRIKENPEQAQAIWDEYEAAFREKLESESRER